ncbi:MAG: hypothetical protein ACOYXA_19330 [Bacteroidota bacterium]
MKENDFQEIGKRLHHMEADPPQDGWKKIGAALRAEQPSAKAVWWRRHGWKPLLLFVPAAVYFIYPQPGIESNTLAVEIAQSDSKPLENPGTEERTPVQSKERALEGRDTRQPNADAGSVVPLADGGNGQSNKLNEERLATLNENEFVPFDDSAKEDGPKMDDVQLALTEPAPDADSAHQVLITPNTVDIDSAELETIIPNEKRAHRPWRISAYVVPQYQARTVMPATADEVLVTDVSKPDWRSQVRAGWALGVGKAVTPNLCLDMHLSYVSIQQDIYFGYATGKVDTLLAVLQADQTVQVTPVYEVNYREIRSRYNYAGLRLAATYYFWNTARSRWNLMAGVGTHYLVSASINEKVENRWQSLPEDNLNRANVSLTVGGGYNILFNRGWELMINPSLTYYLREARSQSLPYSMNQRSAGVTLMLSKTLGMGGAR